MDNFIAGTGWVRSLDIELGNHLNLEVLLGGGGTAILRRSVVREERAGEKSVGRNISTTRRNLRTGIAPKCQDQRSLLSVPCMLRPCIATTLNPKPSALSFFEPSTASLQMATCKLSWRLTLSTPSILQIGRPLSTRLLAPPRVTTIRAGSSVATRSSPSWAFGTSLATGGPCMIPSPPCGTLAQMVRYITSKGLQGDSKVILLRCCGSAPPSILCGPG